MVAENGKLQNEGFNKLARVLQKRTQDITVSPLVLDFGDIQSDYSLKTNTFPAILPVTDYQVCRTLTYGRLAEKLADTQAGTGRHPHGQGGAHGGHEGGDGSHTHPAEGGHAHPVLIPDKMQSVKPGDRVLVAWVGNDAVVIDVIYPAEEART